MTIIEGKPLAAPIFFARDISVGTIFSGTLHSPQLIEDTGLYYKAMTHVVNLRTGGIFGAGSLSYVSVTNYHPYPNAQLVLEPERL